MAQTPLPVPAHFGIIPDGNRRYARAHGLSVAEGYLIGLDRVVDMVRWLLDGGVRHVSAYAASQDNVRQRPRIEMTAVFTALGRFFAELEKTPGIGLHVFGELDEIPDWAPNRQRFLDLREPRESDRLTVHFGLNYSGSDEIPYLLRQAAKHGLDAVTSAPERYSLSAGVPPLDLVIRSGGQKRLSGFLPFQSSYAELWYTDKFWPEVTVQDVQEAFEWYASQPRNFGK